jgi:predicted transcriptional regulator
MCACFTTQPHESVKDSTSEFLKNNGKDLDDLPDKLRDLGFRHALIKKLISELRELENERREFQRVQNALNQATAAICRRGEERARQTGQAEARVQHVGNVSKAYSKWVEESKRDLTARIDALKQPVESNDKDTVLLDTLTRRGPIPPGDLPSVASIDKLLLDRLFPGLADTGS